MGNALILSVLFWPHLFWPHENVLIMSRHLNQAYYFSKKIIFYSIKRVNFLFKDRNPNFKKGHFQWRKNNSLVAGRINKIFDAEDQLIDLSFEKLNELHPFPGLFDCELEPDYIDGGHGLQV